MPTFFYLVLEPVGATIYWCCVLYAMNTNKSCQELGDSVCEEVPLGDLDDDYIRRPHAWWIALLTPGLIFDITFVILFGRPVQMKRVMPDIEVRSLDRTVVPKKGGGIGGIGVNNETTLRIMRPDSPRRGTLTGINRPVSPGSRASNHSPRRSPKASPRNSNTSIH